MRDCETELLTHMKALEQLNSDFKKGNKTLIYPLIQKKTKLIADGLERLQQGKLGTVSADFMASPEVASWISNHGDNFTRFLHFVQTNPLNVIEARIKTLVGEYHRQLKDTGAGIPPSELYSQSVIRAVYLSENKELIDIFKRHLPLPSPYVFKDDTIPPMILEKNAAIEQSINAIQQRSPHLSLDELTDKIVMIQRRLRSKLRYQEELKRIASRPIWKSFLKDSSPEQCIHDANTPYRPRCADQVLAARIMAAAQKVRLFATVKHLTSGEHLKNIFDDALYGRRQLLESYKSFRPASLFQGDIDEGDGNVICFGPCDIDSRAMKDDTVEILFDFDKLSKNKSNIFFKQRDLGFGLDRVRTISISPARSTPLFFSHTSFAYGEKKGCSYFHLYHSVNRSPKAAAWVPNYALISYNVGNIHQILTLNFFKLIDSEYHENFQLIRDEIYTDLASLSDEALIECLENIGRQLCDTSELNFYAAHQIDFSTVMALTYYQHGSRSRAPYTLNIQNLIDSLESRDISMLEKAKTHIPGALNSYRFLDYLSSKVTSHVGLEAIHQLRAQCTPPSWVQSEAALAESELKTDGLSI